MLSFLLVLVSVGWLSDGCGRLADVSFGDTVVLLGGGCWQPATDSLLVVLYHLRQNLLSLSQQALGIAS